MHSQVNTLTVHQSTDKSQTHLGFQGVHTIQLLLLCKFLDKFLFKFLNKNKQNYSVNSLKAICLFFAISLCHTATLRKQKQDSRKHVIGLLVEISFKLLLK